MSASVPMLDLPGSRSSSHASHSASIPALSSTFTSNNSDEEDEAPTFDSPQEEAAHYREKYRRILDTLDETRAELDEFQQSSRELEEELEKDLQATEKEKLELKEKIARLEIEKDEWKAKHVALQKLHSSTTSSMQREMDNLRSERDKTLVALRDLEMGNDELERNERVAVSSLLDLESKYNRAIEEKTLLEQEVVQRQELEEECQRLKDDVRDANNEIAILRDQLTRTVPTPPSSVSVNMSPVHEASRELSSADVPPVQLEELRVVRPASTPEPPLRVALVRSNTASSIPTMSPSVKRHSTRLGDSPSGISSLARSTTSRNLAHSTASPSLARNRSSMGPNARPLASQAPNPNLAAKTKGFRLLHDLQARLKATDDKLGARAPKRLISGGVPLGITRRTISTARPKPDERTPTGPTGRPAPVMRKESTPTDPDKSGATFLSPNGWVMVGEETPVSGKVDRAEAEPASPLETNFRSASAASGRSAKSGKSGTSGTNKPLPTRPGIPSPLIAELRRSTTSSRLAERATASKSGTRLALDEARTPARPPSRGSTSAYSTRPASRSEGRPMSPSLLQQPSTRSYMRSPTPTFGQALSASTSASSSRPASRTTHRTLGRGHPPVSKAFPSSPGAGLASSVGPGASTPSGASTPGLRRSSRRSSLGPLEAGLPPTGIPAPASGGVRTPGRPISVPVFGNGTPPPVPRIPSAHLRNGSRDKFGAGLGLGASTREKERAKTMYEPRE